MNKKIMRKLLIATILLILFLMKFNISNAWVEKEEEVKPWMVNIYNFSTGEIKYEPITKMFFVVPTKKVIENPEIVSKLKDEEAWIEISDFGKLIEGFFDWLILRGIM